MTLSKNPELLYSVVGEDYTELSKLPNRNITHD